MILTSNAIVFRQMAESVTHDCSTCVAAFSAMTVSLLVTSESGMWRCNSAKKVAIIASCSIAAFVLLNALQLNLPPKLPGLKYVRHTLNLVSILMPQIIYISLDFNPRCAKPAKWAKNAAVKFSWMFTTPLLVYAIGSEDKVQDMACNLLHKIAPDSGTYKKYSDKAQAAAQKAKGAAAGASAGFRSAGPTKFSPYGGGDYTPRQSVDVEAPNFVKPSVNHKTTVLYGKNSKRPSAVARFDGRRR